jgi:hypothetical protein
VFGTGQIVVSIRTLKTVGRTFPRPDRPVMQADSVGTKGLESRTGRLRVNRIRFIRIITDQRGHQSMERSVSGYFKGLSMADL